MARRIFGFAKIASISSVAFGTQLALRPYQFRVQCQESRNETNDAIHESIVIEDKELDDEEWLLEKEKCSFCSFFIASPCRNQFIKWSKCVDVAKSKEMDFVKACSVYTKALMDCTTENDEYFSKARDADHGDDEAEDDEESTIVDDEDGDSENISDNLSQQQDSAQSD